LSRHGDSADGAGRSGSERSPVRVRPSRRPLAAAENGSPRAGVSRSGDKDGEERRIGSVADPERIASALSGMSESEIDAPPPERDEELIRRVAETLMRGGSDAERLRVVIDALASAK